MQFAVSKRLLPPLSLSGNGTPADPFTKSLTVSISSLSLCALIIALMGN